MHPHVPGDTLATGCIIDGYQPLPLLHCAGNLCWDAQTLLLDLSIEAIEVQMDDGAMIGMQALASPADLHVTCRPKASFGSVDGMHVRQMANYIKAWRQNHSKLTCESKA